MIIIQQAIPMTRLTVSIPDELEKELRKAVYDRYGMKKGNISKAVVEALRLWLKSA